MIDHEPHDKNFHKEGDNSGNYEINYLFCGFFSGLIFTLKNPNFVCDKSKNNSNDPSDNSGWNGLGYRES